jgi:tetratricopeptide (TPR) repeat protein
VLHEAGQAGAVASGLGVAGVTVDEALGRLAEQSLLSFSLDGQVVIAHRLVLRVVRDQLAKQLRLAAVYRTAAAALEARAVALTGSQDRPAVRDLPEQVTALQYAVAGSSREPDDELAAILLRLRSWGLYHLMELGDSAQQAIWIGLLLIVDQEWVLGPDHPDTLASRNTLAVAYRDVGWVAGAIRLHEQVLAACERKLGPDDPHTLASRNNLANAYGDVGRVAEAILLYEQVLATQERILGPDHPHTLLTLINLSPADQAAGRMAEAILLHERAMVACERVLGPDHPRTLASRTNLAYQAPGQVAETTLRRPAAVRAST